MLLLIRKNRLHHANNRSTIYKKYKKRFFLFCVIVCETKWKLQKLCENNLIYILLLFNQNTTMNLHTAFCQLPKKPWVIWCLTLKTFENRWIKLRLEDLSRLLLISLLQYLNSWTVHLGRVEIHLCLTNI